MKPKHRSLKSLVGSTLTSLVAVSFTMVANSTASLWTGTAADNNWDNLANWDSNPSGGVGQVDALTNIPIITVSNTLWPNDLKIAAATGKTGQVDLRSGTMTINYWTFVGDWNGNATFNIAAGTSASPGTFTGLDIGSGSYDANNNGNANFMVGLYQSTGVVNMNTSGSLDVTDVRLSPNGQGGSGTFNLDAGTVNADGSFQVGSDYWGANTASPAYLNMSGGTINAGYEFWHGGSGTGSTTMTGGSISNGTYFVVGRNNGSVGSFDMSGGMVEASTTSGFTTIASFAGSQGTMDLSGGTFHTSNGSNLYVAERGTGTLNVSASGDLNIDGSLRVGENSGAVGITSQTGGTVDMGGGLVVGRFSGATGTVTVSGGTMAVGGTSAVGHEGTGTLTLSSTGTFVQPAGTDLTLGLNGGGGTLQLDGGTLQVGQITQGTGTGTAYLNGGTIQVNSDTDNLISGGLAVYVSNGGAVIDTDGYDKTTGTGLLEDFGSTGGGLTKQGTGTLTLDGANTYTGATAVDAGKLSFTTSQSAGLGGITLADGATLGLQQVAAGTTVTSTGGVTFGSGAGTGLDLDFAGLSSPASALATFAGAATLNGTVDVTLDNVAGLATGTVPLLSYSSKSGAGTFNLLTTSAGHSTFTLDETGTALNLEVVATPNTWTGSTDNIWDVNNSSNWDAGDSVFLESDNVIFDDSGANTNPIDISGDVSPATVTFSNASASYRLETSSYSGIAGNSSLHKTGAGSLVITNENFFTGETTIGSGATLTLGDGTSGFDGTIAYTSGVTNDGTLEFNRYGLLSADYVISGTGNVVKNGVGTQLLSGANTYSGGTTVHQGVLEFDSLVGSATEGVIDIHDGATLAFDLGTQASWDQTVTYTPTINLTGTTTIANNATGSPDNYQGQVAIDGSITGDSVNPLNIDNSGDARLYLNSTITDVPQINVLSGAVGFDISSANDRGTAPVDIANGAALWVGGTTINPIVNNLTFNGGTGVGGKGSLYYEGGTPTPSALSGDVTLTGDLNTGCAYAADTITLGGSVDGTGGITVLSGILSLTGTNSFSGDIHLNGGVLSLGSADAIAGAAANLFFDGGTLRHTAANTTDYSSEIMANAASHIANVKINTNGQTVTWSTGLSADLPGLDKTGAGVLNLSAAAGVGFSSPVNFPGGVNIGNQGSIRVSDGAALGSATVNMPATNNSPMAVELAGGVNLANPILTASRESATGVVNVPFLRNVSGNNEYSGTATANTLGGGICVESQADTLTYSGILQTDGFISERQLWLQGAGDGNFTGQIKHATTGFRVLKYGTGTWALSGSSHNYLGTTTVNDGTLLMNGDLTACTGAVTVNGGALGGTGTVGGSVTVNTGGSIAPGASVGTLTMAAGKSATFLDGSAFEWEVGDWTGAAGTGYDQFVTNVLNGTTAVASNGITIVITENSLANFSEADKDFTIMTYVASADLEVGDFVIDQSAFTSGAGTFAVTSVAGNAVTLHYTAGSASPFADWADANGASGQTPDQDHDNDGVSNGIEYFMGETGSTFTPNPSVIAGMVTWPKDAAFSGTYAVETSPDLVNWTDVTGAVVDGGTSVEYTLPTGMGKLFVHLVVTPN